MTETAANSGPTYRLLGVPLRTGSLYPGTENDAQAYRDARIVDRLRAAGCRIEDDGDLPIPNYLPHHAIPPIRSWPGPRIVWDLVSDRLTPLLRAQGHVPLLVGCDCSVVLGTTQALARASGSDVHVLYIDGDFDDAAPDAGRCQSAAALAVWLLTHQSPFWSGPPVGPEQVTVLGWTTPSQSAGDAPSAVSLDELRRSGASRVARQVLDRIPSSADILVHFDIDVFEERSLPAAYFPHSQGLTLSEGAELADVLLADRRIRIIEISEYAALRDRDRQNVGMLIDLLARALEP